MVRMPQCAYRAVVKPLSLLCDLVPDQLTYVLNHHRVLLELTRSKQSETLDVGASKEDVVAPLGLESAILRRLGVHKLFEVRRVDVTRHHGHRGR